MKKTCVGMIPVAAALLTGAVAAEPIPNLGDLTLGDPFFYTADQSIKPDDGQAKLLGTGRPSRTHSQIPHLPVYIGYMSTNYTYRFVTVAEQVLTMIGEGKHGLWRVQENGTIREYLRPGAKGLVRGADPLAPENLETVRQDYASYLPDEGWDGYRYPDQRVDADGRQTFIDLPVTHPKYEGRYAEHEPIDLPNFYCTMSENDFPYAKVAMDFAFLQAGANKVGPLGKRAGLDIRENYTRVLQLAHFPDARSWVNVGESSGKDTVRVDWKPVDASRTQVEYYLVERPFFNKPYLFLMAVFDNPDNADFRYVRPDGAYWNDLVGKDGLKTEVTPSPRFHLEGGKTAGAVGLPLYGVHHPNRAAFKAGGACPLKGGDWGRYPDTSGGSGWPTQYEEVTPICDAVLVDLKFYANLDGRDWNDPHKYLANAGVGTRQVQYSVQPGNYGIFTDPYNVARGVKNQQQMDVPETITITYPTAEAPVEYVPVPVPSEEHRVAVPAASTSCRPIPG